MIEEALKELHRLCRTAEMSANIMRDPKRTGNWSGSGNVAAAFDRLARDAARVTDILKG